MIFYYLFDIIESFLVVVVVVVLRNIRHTDHLTGTGRASWGMTMGKFWSGFVYRIGQRFVSDKIRP